jgi:hypothetical protein
MVIEVILHVVPGARGAREVALVLPKRSEPCYDLIRFGDLVVNAMVPTSRLPENPECILQSFPPWRKAGEWRWIVVDVILLDQFIHLAFLSSGWDGVGRLGWSASR